MRMSRAGLVFVLLSALAGGCGEESGPAAEVAASNSFLECAVRDLVGAEAPVLRLAPPGTCPGHYDVRPSQVARLHRCRLLLRLDIQKSLDAKLSGPVADGLRIAEIRVGGGLCAPESYRAACRQAAEALVAAGLLDRPSAKRRLADVGRRMAILADRCHERMRPLSGAPVVASVHQEAFCTFLGLRVVATFRGADVESPRRLQRARDAGRDAAVRFVIANRPEGRRAADFLAGKLHARVVVFGNFPALDAGHESFDDLVEENVGRLLAEADR